MGSGRRRPWLLLPLLAVVALAAAARFLSPGFGLGGDSFATKVVGDGTAAAPGGGGGRENAAPLPPREEGKEDEGGGPGGSLGAGWCRALRSHEGGRWVHVSYGGGNNATSSSLNASQANASVPDAAAMGTLSRDYYPAEVDWLRGIGRPATYDKWECKRRQIKPDGLMYLTGLGNQCGCGTGEFEPSHSAWTVAGALGGAENATAWGRRRLSQWASDGAFRLVKALAGRTLCFVGDSIDLQFYHAVGHGLRRAKALYGLNITVDVSRVPVNYTNETGASYYGKGFRYLSFVEQTNVTIDDYRASIQYVKFYGWAPMHLSFADGCHVVVSNLGLHYSESTGRMHNANRMQQGNTLGTDLPALLGWMLDHSSRRDGNAAVWRSALPQHFDTVDGHYKDDGKSKRCKPIPREQYRGRAVQEYNRRYDRVFDRICNASTAPGECAPYEMTCTARRTDPGLSSLHRYYVDSGCCRARRERLERLPDKVTGRVLRWDVADLFDVPSWHVDDADCSHFCYVPGLFGEAFGRLAVLLGGG